MTTIEIPWADKTLNRVGCSISDAREEKVIDVSFTTEGAALGFWSGPRARWLAAASPQPGAERCLCSFSGATLKRS